MSDTRPANLNLDKTVSPNLNAPLDLTALSRSLNSGKDAQPLVAPRSTVPGLSSLEIVPSGAPGSSVLRDSRLGTGLTPPADTTRPAAGTARPADATAPVLRPADATARVADATRVSDAAVRKPVNGVLELEYGDPGFDKSIAQTDYHTLKIRNLPETVRLKPWVDKTGYLFSFEGGNDKEAPHYFPPNLKTVQIEVWNGKQYKPFTKPADELRISAVQGVMAEQRSDKSSFGSFDNKTHPYRYAERMSALAEQQLNLQEKALREGAEASPTNPYFRIYLADILIARAIKPVIEDVKAGKDATLDNPETMKRIDQALEELAKARLITQKHGDIRVPNTYQQPPLFPFGLNPYYRNPDAYWSGAAYQSYQREVGLTVVKAWIKSGAIKLQLPPALPPG